jgi:hypothetical protein
MFSINDLSCGRTWSVRADKNAESTGACLEIEQRWRLTGHPSTCRQYAGALRRFEEFCRANRFMAQPATPETVASFIDHRRTIDRVLAASLAADARAIRQGHLACGLPDPTDDSFVRRALGFKRGIVHTPPMLMVGTALSIEGNCAAIEQARQAKVGRPQTSGLPLDTIDELVKRFALQSLARTTREAYAYGLVAFSSFCIHHGLSSLPAEPETVCRFLADYGVNRKPPSLATARAAIRWIHVNHEIFPIPTDHPKVGKVIEGHARRVGTAPRQKAAFTADDIIGMCERMDEDGGIAAIRDKANILLGFCGAFRGSETTSRDRHDDPEMGFFSLDLNHVTFSQFGMSILVVKSKRDQTANGQSVFVTYGLRKETCAVLALQNWIEVLKERGITTGPLFRAVRPRGDRLIGDGRIRDKALVPKSMLVRLKHWAKRIGLDPKTIGYHSLRSGHVTAAADGGASFFSIVQQGRWKSADTAMRYYRKALAHKDNSSSTLGI